MAKIVSVNDVKETKTATEEPQVKLLVARHYDISSKVNLEFMYDNNESKNISIALGDNVDVSYIDDNGTLQKITGVITDICNKDMATSFKSNTNMGNGNYNLQIKIDASEEFDSKVVSIYLINILDISPAEIDPGEDPVLPPISWNEKPILVEDGLLTIPYDRAEPGTVDLVVSHGEDVVVFREEFVADAANKDASFTWSLRDFSSLNNTSIEGLVYDKDGNYIYHNGDNTKPEVTAVDRDDSKIIPANTALNISISHFDELNTESKISKVYTVTEQDVLDVTNGYIPPVTPNRYTITSLVENGTVANSTVEVEEGNTTTIVFTPNEGYDLVNVTINEVPVEATINDGVVSIMLVDIRENKNINVTFAKTPSKISSTSTISDGEAIIAVSNNSIEDIPVTLNIKASDDTVVYKEERTLSAGVENELFTWDLRKYKDNPTEEELYNIKNTNADIVSVGNYTYEISSSDNTISDTIAVADSDITATSKDACWLYNDEPSVSDGLLNIKYNRLVPGDVQLVVKAADSIVFKEEYNFLTTNANASFTWSLRDFSSLNNTSIEGLNYDEDGVYVYHNGDNTKAEVTAVDRDNDKIIPAGTVLDITITRGKSVLTKQYTVTDEDVIAVTY